MTEEVHIEVSAAVREQLRCLEPADRNEIFEGLNEALNASRGSPRRYQQTSTMYVVDVWGYRFTFERLTREDLERIGESSGYHVVRMRSLPDEIIGNLYRRK